MDMVFGIGQIFAVFLGVGGLYWKVENVRKELDSKIEVVRRELISHRIHGNGDDK